MSAPTRADGPGRALLRRFWRKPRVVPALALLLALYAAAAAAPFVAPCDPLRSFAGESHVPPNVGFVDGAGRARPWPMVLAQRSARDPSGRRTFTPDLAPAPALRWFVHGDAWSAELPLLPTIGGDLHLFGPAPGGRFPHLLGTDQRGRDLFARILFGARISLTIGLVGVAISFAIGLIVGGLSGWLGGRVDELLMRICEVLMLLPGFYVLLALRGTLPDASRLTSSQTYFAVVAIVSAIWWAGLARAVRGQVLAVKQRESVHAARALGAGTLRIVVRHLLPETLSFAVVSATLSIPGYILMESALSMLGLGIQEPEPSWGNLLAEATRISQIAEHPWVLAPGVFLCVAVLAFQSVGDGLRDALDPRDA
jgi:peptide/nickel transport system permease protein